MFFLTTDDAWEKAKDYALRAHEAFDGDCKIVFERLRDIWTNIANARELGPF